MKVLAVAFALMIICPAYAAGVDVLWEKHFREAEAALEHSDYWTAKRLLRVSVAEAQRCRQQSELAKKLKFLAGEYAAKNRWRVAEALRKQAEKICAD